MIQKPKGTYDLYGDSAKKYKKLEEILTTLMEKYNYNYIKTPLFEASELFHRGVGETSDIVSKETYDFVDRGNRNMTLRPEGTAGVVRSFIENKMYADPLGLTKVWYMGPMYRYERPQSGRFREFIQYGVEVFGSNDPMLDTEIISIPVNFFKMLGLKGIKVNVNTLGDVESHNKYREALIEYFKPHLDELCEDCKKRYEKNPLRILDCKVDHDLECMKKAPKTIEYLNETSKNHFDSVLKYLDEIGIAYEVNTSIVRGLDYYTHTVFEIEASVEGFGSQNVLCAGGRYDGLVETIGGPKTSGVGFAMGTERLMTALEYENINLLDNDGIDIYIIPMGKEEKSYSFKLLQELRMNGFNAEIDYLNKNIKANFKQADKLNTKYVIIIGEEEVKSNILTIKNNQTKEEYKIKQEEMIDFFDHKIEE